MFDSLIVTNGDSAVDVLREGGLEGEILQGVNWRLFSERRRPWELLMDSRNEN